MDYKILWEYTYKAIENELTGKAAAKEISKHSPEYAVNYYEGMIAAAKHMTKGKLISRIVGIKILKFLTEKIIETYGKSSINNIINALLLYQNYLPHKMSESSSIRKLIENLTKRNSCNYTVVTDETEINNIEKQFVEKIKIFLTETIKASITDPHHKNEDQIVSYCKEPLMWFSEKDLGNRYMHAFGTNNPSETKYLPINLEINIAKSADKRVAGMFLKDQYGNICLGHSGKLGGGKEGVGKNAFLDSISDCIDLVDYKKEVANAIIISDINSENLVKNIYNFLLKVKMFKDPLPSSHIKKKKAKNIKTIVPILGNEPSFKPESSKRKSATIKAGTIEYDMLHSRVVKALHEKLGFDYSDAVKNNQKIDLFLLKGDDTFCIFEVKSSKDSYAIYTAIGQLYYHGLEKLDALKVIVLPHGIDNDTKIKIESLEIEVVTFEENQNGMIDFYGLQFLSDKT